MLRVTLRSFWEHKRRLVSTIVAIVLGVAFMAGTFVLTDTLGNVFDDLFGDYKLSYSSNSADLNGGGTLETDVWTNSFILGLAYRFGQSAPDAYGY